MRAWLVTAAVAIALTGAGCNRQPSEEHDGSAVAKVETPKRKPGLWKQTLTVEGTDLIQTANLCLDEATDQQMAWWAQQGIRVGCVKNDVTRQADGSWAFASVCDMAGGIRTSTNGVAIGDFENRYQVRAESTTNNAPIAQLNGTRSVTIDASWQGECPAGMKPGEMELPDGRRVDVLGMANNPPAPAAP